MWPESKEEAHSDIAKSVPAWIKHGNGTLTAVIVVAMTDYGAELAINADVALPDLFSLRLPYDPGRRTCCVLWREGDNVGVRFVRSEANAHDNTSLGQDS